MVEYWHWNSIVEVEVEPFVDNRAIVADGEVAVNTSVYQAVH